MVGRTSSLEKRRSASASLVLLVPLTVLGVSLSNAQETATQLKFVSAVPAAHLRLADTLHIIQRPSLQTESSYKWYSPVTNLPGDWISAGQEAFRTQSIPTLLSVGGATTVLLLSDRATYHASRTFYQRHAFVEHMSDALVHLGSGTTHLGIAASFGLYGLLMKDDRALETGGQVVEGLLATGVAVQLLKRMTGRESPASAPGGIGRWRPFPSLAGYQRNQPKYYSFPSGHIAATMATLTIIAENYPENPWIKPVGYSLIGAVGVSLVNIRYHWFSDLPLGMLLGYTFGELAAHHGRVRNDDQGTRDVQFGLEPSVTREGTGIQVSCSF